MNDANGQKINESYSSNAVECFKQAFDSNNTSDLSRATELLLQQFLDSLLGEDFAGLQVLDGKLRELLAQKSFKNSQDSSDIFLYQLYTLTKLTESLYRKPSIEVSGKIQSMKHRTTIFKTLMDRTIVTPTELGHNLGVRSQRASQIFSLLASYNLVGRKKVGKTVYYHLTAEGRSLAHHIFGQITSTENTLDIIKKALLNLREKPRETAKLAEELEVPESFLSYALSPLIDNKIIELEILNTFYFQMK